MQAPDDAELTGQGPLTEDEIMRLLAAAPRTLRDDIGRLVREIRQLRDEAAERQFMAETEREM